MKKRGYEVKAYSRYDRLDEVEKKLQQYGFSHNFCRVHQSFLVNMKYAKDVERYKVTLENGTEISISKKYYKDVEKEYIRKSLVVMGIIFPGRFLDFSSVFMFYGNRIFSTALAYGIIFCIRKMLGSKTTDIFTVREWYALAAISLITILSVITITYETDWMKYASQPVAVDFFHIHIVAGILCINFIGYYLIHSITEREIKLREHAVFREKVKNETAMYHSISENLEKQRKRTREYKNQLAAINALAAEGAYQELRAYIGKIETLLQHRMDAVDTNHVIVNAILNTKYREAVSKGIVFVMKVNDLSELKMEEDIVVILSNLLNNALEACERCEDKQIKLKFVLEDGQAVISVKNSMAVEPVMENGALLTSKTKEPEEHGVGIQNVVETVERTDFFLFS